MRRRILYIAMVLALLYLNAMYNWDEGKWFLAVVLAAPLVEFLFLIFAAWNTRADFFIRPGKEVVTKGDEVFLEWKMSGPFSKYLEGIKVQWRESVSFGRKKGKKKSMKVPAGRANSISVKVIWSGHLKMEVLKYSFTGPVGLIRIRKKTNVQEKIVVLPKQMPIQVEGEFQKTETLLDSSGYSKVKPGDDPAEIFDVRPYRYGDKISRIHWKITAREDELYVKEFSLPISASMALLIEKDEEIKTGERADAFYTLLASVVLGLVERGEPFFVAWNLQEKGMNRFLVSDEESCYTMLFAFLDEELFSITNDAERIWKETYPGDDCRFLVLTEGLHIKAGGEERIKFDQNNLEEKLEGWVLEL